MSYEDRKKQAENDGMLKLCKEQGYVPEGCVLAGSLVYALTNETGDACKGCNEDRRKCKGRPA